MKNLIEQARAKSVLHDEDYYVIDRFVSLLNAGSAVIVPRKPTEAMLNAGTEPMKSFSTLEAGHIYGAMIAAALEDQ